MRYSAMQGLAKICRCCASDKTREGIRTVAWNALVTAHSLERDTRVLEALKMGKVRQRGRLILKGPLHEANILFFFCKDTAALLLPADGQNFHTLRSNLM